jgi:hypothetical protein
MSKIELHQLRVGTNRINGVGGMSGGDLPSEKKEATMAMYGMVA